MSSRRIVAYTLMIFGILFAVLPGAADAGALDGVWGVPDGPDESLLSRVLAWLETLWSPSEVPFTSQEGASITGNG